MFHRHSLIIEPALQQLFNSSSANDESDENINTTNVNDNNNDDESRNSLDVPSSTKPESSSCSRCDCSVAASESFLRRRGPNACASVVITQGDDTETHRLTLKSENDVFGNVVNSDDVPIVTLIASVLSVRLAI